MSSTCRTSNSRYAGFLGFANHGQQCQLDSCSETTWVGEFGASANLLTLEFWQTIYIAVVLVAIVLREVDDFQCVRTVVFIPKSGTLAVARAEEEHVDGV